MAHKLIETIPLCQVRWYPPVILAHFRQRPEDDMLEVSLSYNQNPVSPKPQLAPPPQT